ncbi:polymer-forming cytoskeletal protein [Candidatus Nitronereus thalassa]|uniref:Polymer-forming cytoskeletal protein n=1 Tax=Candidatus Nitronereus thalassa TaxID=3020898 RepID=A0ABU3K966_9BACT|nr:polymer-forming cytoskeletal protein [Candidatus Nitronereus thalassa]MDT7042907.1 polymer-forming cytoskeletal protein [Candidatus Nitronereus thalassa]
MWGDKDEKKKKETIFEEDHYTFLGKGVDFKGKANFDGTVRVDGHFEGEITTADTLIIGEHAVIKGSIIGGVIVSGGKVEGNIVASKKVQLLKPAVLIGDVQSPSFSMEEGVLFQGVCDMGISHLDDLEPSTTLENVHDLNAHRDHKLRSQEA